MCSSGQVKEKVQRIQKSGVYSETQQTVTGSTAAGRVLVWSLVVLRSFYFSKASVEKEKKVTCLCSVFRSVVRITLFCFIVKNLLMLYNENTPKVCGHLVLQFSA